MPAIYNVENINEIFRAKSTEEFVQILSQEIHKDDFEVRNLLRTVGKVDPKQYTNEVYAFNALGAAFFTFGQEILQMDSILRFQGVLST